MQWPEVVVMPPPLPMHVIPTIISQGTWNNGQRVLLFNGVRVTEDLLARSPILSVLMNMTSPVQLPISDMDFLMWSEIDDLRDVEQFWTLQRLECLAKVRQFASAELSRRCGLLGQILNA